MSLSRKNLQKRIRECRQEYADLKARIREVGFVCEGSLVERWMPCGKPTCRCASDPSKRHGPYYQLSWKEEGKTVSRRLLPAEATLYREWITNRNRLNTLLDRMRSISRKAGRYLLATANEASPSPRPLARRPHTRKTR
jgi:Family of unknown function (DUF6788)